MRLPPGFWLLALSVAACGFEGGIGPGFQCGEDGWCPAGQSCVGGFCTADPGTGDGGPDADPNAPDAAPTEARCGTLSALRDDFADGVVGPHFWGWADPGASIAESGGHVVIDVAAGTADAWAGYSGRFLYDLVGSTWEARVSEVGARYTDLEIRAHDGSRVQLMVEDGTLLAVVQGTADAGTRATTPYVAATHAYWRIREQDGTLYWETSPDRTTWNELHAEATPIATDHVFGMIAAGGQLSSASRIRFDDVNLVAAGDLCPADTLRDDFPGTALGPQWEYWTGGACSVTVADGVMRLDFPSGDGDIWCGIDSRHVYDFRDSAMVLDASLIPGPDNFVTWLQVLDPTDGSTLLEIGRDEAGVLFANQNLAGVSMAGATRVYDPVADRYWRIRGAGGRVYMETSPDRATWNLLLDDDARFDLAETILEVGAGAYSVGPGVAVTVDVPAFNP